MNTRGCSRVEPPWGVLPSETGWEIGDLEQLPLCWVNLRVADGLCVRLGRFRKPGSSRVVLLVHGASAGSRTFMVPHGGLIRYLVEHGFDVWTLDWRSSNLFSSFNRPEHRHLARQQRKQVPYWTFFNLDAAARFDLLGALNAIGKWLAREAPQPAQPRPLPQISIVAHCVGGAVVAQALAAGLLTSGALSFRLGPVVLSTLALFYRVGLEGWVKGNEFLLEQLTASRHKFPDPEHPVINPVLETGRKWPRVLEFAFQTWRTTCFSPNGWGGQHPPLVERLAFMYGMPFHTSRLAKSLTTDALALQFGDMPLGIYLHCVRNLRVGYATRFVGETDATYIQTQHLLPGGVPVVPLTLLTGAQNQVWHRDSIDRMYEWLVNGTKPEARSRLSKLVLPDFAHQDLLWSDESPRVVYPEIARGLLTRGGKD